jgi:hypothetical protein
LGQPGKAAGNPKEAERGIGRPRETPKEAEGTIGTPREALEEARRSIGMPGEMPMRLGDNRLKSWETRGKLKEA